MNVSGIRLALMVCVAAVSLAPANGQDLALDWTTCMAPTASHDASIKACGNLLDSGALTPQRQAKVLAHRGWAHDSKGAYAQAIRDYDRSIALDPTSGIAFYGRAGAYHRQGDEMSSLKDLDEAIRLDPTIVEAWNGRCWSRATLGQFEAARGDCEQALRLRPDDPATLDSLGFIELKLGRHDAAIAAHDQAIRHAPTMPSPYYARGIARQRKDDAAGGAADISIEPAPDVDPTSADELGTTMPASLSVAIGLIMGFGVIGGVFWFAFARAPEPRRIDEEQPNPSVEILAQNLSPVSDPTDGAP